MKKDTRLNTNQELFCQFYTSIGRVTFGHTTRSYQEAYPDCKTENSAAASGSSLLRIPKIQSRINQLHQENLTKNGVTIESVLANIQHDRLKAREAGQWAVAKGLDELEGRHLTMFSDKLVSGTAEYEPKVYTDEERAAYQEGATIVKLRLAGIKEIA